MKHGKSSSTKQSQLNIHSLWYSCLCPAYKSPTWLKASAAGSTSGGKTETRTCWSSTWLNGVSQSNMEGIFSCPHTCDHEYKCLCVQCNRTGLWFAAAADGPGVQPPDWWRAGTGPPATLQHPVQDGAEVAADWLSSVTPPPRSKGRGCQVTSDLWPLRWLTVLSFTQTSTRLLFGPLSDQEPFWTSGVRI